MSAYINAAFPALFNVKDINFSNGTLTFTLYSEDLYDAAAIDKLQSGDTLLYNQDTLLVQKVSNANGTVIINDDIENGGACLEVHDQDSYRAVQLDNHSVYSKKEVVTLPLSPLFTIMDCGEFPTDATKIIRQNQEEYLQGLPEYRQTFTFLDTRVMVNNGQVTHIVRSWIP
ncbi:MAG: hypothetical protein KBT08_09040 [Bacteroidales bacterium]|nr:hypothetical protein [Candidatus Cryptobacteroides onthequi]